MNIAAGFFFLGVFFYLEAVFSGMPAADPVVMKSLTVLGIAVASALIGYSFAQSLRRK